LFFAFDVVPRRDLVRQVSTASNRAINLSSLFEVDILTTHQFSKVFHQKGHFEPEERLMFAVLTDAVECFQAQSQSSLDALRGGESAKTPANSALKEIFFEFDRYDLSSDSRATLRAAADWLKKNPAVRVEVEGHCDERGTTEYNLALGDKRAHTAMDYLETLGVAAGRLSTTSYGEEIPVCREHNEECWQKNRRDRFVTLTAKPRSLAAGSVLL
jgi:peptidoglycan-associated lipoprotein